MKVHPDVARVVEKREEARRRNVGAATLSIRLPEDLRRDAAVAAGSLGVSLNAFVVAALDVAVRAADE